MLLLWPTRATRYQVLDTDKYVTRQRLGINHWLLLGFMVTTPNRSTQLISEAVYQLKLPGQIISESVFFGVVTKLSCRLPVNWNCPNA